MKLYNLKNFKLGWFIGDFEPTIISTKDVEVSVKRYKAGEYDKKHYHKVADEITVIIQGEGLVNGVKYSANDILHMEKNDAADFLALTDIVTCVIKLPSVIGDKYIV